jgi:hypothetical protein
VVRISELGQSTAEDTYRGGENSQHLIQAGSSWWNSSSAISEQGSLSFPAPTWGRQQADLAGNRRGRLFHGDRLGQIARLVHIGAF